MSGEPAGGRPWLAWYEFGVPHEVETPEVSLTWYLDEAADRHPHRTALIFCGLRVSYRSLRDQVDRFAAGLRSLGVRRGDRVALILPNCPQYVIGFLGALRIGAVPVGHNPLYTVEEMAHQLDDCRPRVAVVLDQAYATFRAVAHPEHVIVTSILDYLPTAKRLALSLPLSKVRRRRTAITAEVPRGRGLIDFVDFLRAARPETRQAPVGPIDDLAAILYTGGTEGPPKGVMLTHRNLLVNARQCETWDPSRGGVEVTLAVLPLFHSFGLTTCLTLPLTMAGTVVLVPRLEAREVIGLIRRHRVTLLPAVPPVYDRLLNEPGLRGHSLRSLRVCISGAMGLPAEAARRFHEVTGCSGLVEAYGLTEASPAVLCNPLNGNARHVSAGLPMPGTDVIIVDEDDPSVVLPPGQAGELVVRGPQVFAGYWNRPDETERVLSKGWLRTGDIAVMSPDGFFTVLERKHDLIKVSGFSVYPSEVEEVLRQHPVVNDCAVIALPDQHTGERVTACVVVHPAYPFSAEELGRHCDTHLTPYKVPHEFVLVDAIPRSLNGKLQRAELRRRYTTLDEAARHRS